MISFDPYIALGVPRTATREEIARAYRSAVKRSHPDTGASTSPAQMARITEAWRILGDPTRRARWDAEHSPITTPLPWSAPMGQQEAIRPRRPEAPPSRLDSGWTTAAVVGGLAAVLGSLMLWVSLAAGPALRTASFASDEMRFDYPDAWTVTAGHEDPAAPHRVVAHLTSFSTDADERCVTFGERCRWEGAVLPSGGASVQVFAWEGIPPPEPEPDAHALIGGQPSAHARTTVGDEFLSAWWQLSPPGFPDRWIEVRAEIRGGDLERGRRMAEVEALLESLEFVAES